MINTVIIDAGRQDREKLVSLLSSNGDIKVLAKGNDGYDAVKLTGSLKPDIVILNDHPKLIEEEILPLLKARSPATNIVILAAAISDNQLLKAASNKVSGFVHKATEMEILPGILKCILDGGCFISPVLAGRILKLFCTMNKKNINMHVIPLNRSRVKASRQNAELNKLFQKDPMENLTKIELRILSCIGEGCIGKDIAKSQNLAEGTIRNYISSIMHKTGMQNRSQMARYACYHGLARLNIL